MPKQVIKRDGRIVQFDPKKIHTATIANYEGKNTDKEVLDATGKSESHS